ncbi:MAG TPA: glycosyltransferase family 9 protein [Flavobacteriales bacterium]|nr:glycosyltransferase family 9 protein [Flavobacteriales bacterium]
MKKILVIQTAFLGDVILATALVEELRLSFSSANIDMLVCRGNEALLIGNPQIDKVLVFDKQDGKMGSLLNLISQIRSSKYSVVINVHRFGSSGLLCGLSGAKTRIGFDKNPFSFLFTKRVKHIIGDGTHEVERNHELIVELTRDGLAKPKLYPSDRDFQDVQAHKANAYICIAPASIWFTKQFPKQKWIELIKIRGGAGYLIGSEADSALCSEICDEASNPNYKNLAGKLTLLQTAALMRDAAMNYVNDSAPMHIASAMNAPVTAVYCSTIPEYGFGPLSENSTIVQTNNKLDCRPCGIHGHKSCPKGHFDCVKTINIDQLL